MTADPGDQAWADYLAAAQRLDAVRRGAASSAAEQDRTVRGAREELAVLAARLAPQRARLRELGVPDDLLVPQPADAAAAARTVGDGPPSALAALRGARLTADAADAAALGRGLVGGPSHSPAWLRNLLVYGPFAAVVLVVQLALYLVVDSSSLPAYAALCGLLMPAAAFGLGWLVVGLAFAPGTDGRVDRSPLVGAVVCFAPVLLTCMGVGVLAIAR